MRLGAREGFGQGRNYMTWTTGIGNRWETWTLRLVTDRSWADDVHGEQGDEGSVRVVRFGGCVFNREVARSTMRWATAWTRGDW